MCVLDINMALSPNRTSGSMKREKKSQDRKRRMIKREAEGNDNIMVLTLDLQVVLLAPRVFKNEITSKLSFAVMTLQSTTCLTVMSCGTSGLR